MPSAQIKGFLDQQPCCPQPAAEPPTGLQSRLLAIDKKLTLQPESIALLFLKGNLLEKMGRGQEARNAYVELLDLDPFHLGTLNQLGNLLCIAAKKVEARSLFLRAVARFPDDPASRANLASLLIEEGEIEAARQHCEHALKIDGNCRQAHAGLLLVFTKLGLSELASRHRHAAFQGRCVIPVAYRGEQPPITVLELISISPCISRITSFLLDCVFQKYLVVADFYDPSTPLPPHQLVVNSIGDADLAGAALAGAQSVLAHTKAPVINSPAAVLATGRCDIARLLSGVPGVISPKTISVSRELLAAADLRTTLTSHGFEFPLLMRTPGFHGGEHFLRVGTLADIPAALLKLPGRDLTVIQYLDARTPDGKTRKYRVMMVDGQLYPLHAAISRHWKIHYFSAEMADCPQHRAEDAAFLADMPGVLGTPAMAALEQIQKILGLDYGGIDFGLNDKGKILFFEANAAMTVLPPGADTRWDYRRPAVEKIYQAVWKMLIRRAIPYQQKLPSGA